MDQETSYLKHLKFDPNLLKSPIAKYLANPRLVFLFIFIIIILGVYSYTNLPRSLNPEIKIPIVLVSTILPGAGPNDIESLITIPIEDAVKGVDKVKTVNSTSRDSASIVQIEFESGIDPDKARTDIQSAVDTVQDLPTDAQPPDVIKLDFENQPVWQFSLTTTGDIASLSRFSQTLKDRIEDLSTIDRVTTTGVEEQEIQIVVKPEAVATYGLNPAILSQAIKTATSALPAGSIQTQNSSYALAIDPSIVSVDDVRALKITVNQTVVSLSDIATIAQRSKPGQVASLFAAPDQRGSPSISFAVYRTTGENINKAAADAQAQVDQVLEQYPNQFKIHTILNAADEISTEFNNLQRDFIFTISLVFLILFIFVGLRQALVALFAAPLTFFVAFTVMLVTNISLSFISLFSLLLSLGLLVDDTIVVISAMTAYHRSGKFTPLQTGLLVWRDFFIPVLTTTITTVWAFIPLLLSTGIIGEFIKPIPIVVSTTLMASLIVAMLITLPLMIVLLSAAIPRRVQIFLRILAVVIALGLFYFLVPKTGLILVQVLAFLIVLLVLNQIRGYLRNQVSIPGRIAHYMDQGVISFSRIDRAYSRLISRILTSFRARRLTVAMVVIFSLFSYLLVPFGFVQNEFFPATDEDSLYIAVELPPGTNANVSQKEAAQLVEDLRPIPGLEFITADVGQAFSSMGGTEQGEANNILITLRLHDAKDRDHTSSEIAQELRQKFANYTTGKLSINEVSGGPPAGADLQINLLGDDLTQLNQYAAKIQDYLKTLPGVTNVDQSIKSGTSKITFVPDQALLSASGLGQDALGLWLRTFASGFTADTLRIDNLETDIVFRLKPTSQTVTDLGAITVPTPQGGIPLSGLGKFVLEPNPTLISREDGKRTLAVSASVTAGNPVPELNKKLEDYAKSLNLADGYSWKTGGVNEENQRSVNSILSAMGLSFLLIVTTMVIQFSSFRKALIVMLVIPLATSGVFILFALTRTPLSFPALIGVLALFGIVVKNSILVVDKISANLDTGMEFNAAIVDGAVSRLEAIALTSFATIAGLIPVTLSDPLWRGLGGAIIAGLTFSGTIMLFFIPVVYYFWFHPTAQVKRVKIK